MMGLGQSQVRAASGLGWGWRAMLSFLDALEAAGSWQGGVSLQVFWFECVLWCSSSYGAALHKHVRWGSWS